ncbi:unnamed protein product [Rotaria sp. Silwood2]|nr:unnamed protein product [Rotaria sp. Silwood2]CAF3992121.1 unnamed protein product [Rotaria sp. Silwood2]
MIFIDKSWKIVSIPIFYFFTLFEKVSVNSLIIKSEDLQKVVALKHQNGDYRTKFFPDLNGVLGLTTIKRWCKMIDETGFINLTTSPGPLRTIRTEDAIKKVKQKLQQNKISSRKLALELGMSRTSA